jgi:hypothetical protein
MDRTDRLSVTLLYSWFTPLSVIYDNPVSYDLWIREFEFWKSGDSGFRISEFGIWEFGTLI